MQHLKNSQNNPLPNTKTLSEGTEFCASSVFALGGEARLQVTQILHSYCWYASQSLGLFEIFVIILHLVVSWLLVYSLPNVTSNSDTAASCFLLCNITIKCSCKCVFLPVAK